MLVARAALHLWFLIQLPSMWDVVAGGWVWPLAFASSVPLLFKVRRSGAFISRRLGPSGRGGHSLSMVQRVATCCTVSCNVVQRGAPCCNVVAYGVQRTCVDSASNFFLSTCELAR